MISWQKALLRRFSGGLERVRMKMLLWRVRERFLNIGWDIFFGNSKGVQ